MPGLRLRTRPSGDGALELELAFDHPMESGARTDGRGTRIPPWYVTRVRLAADGETLAELVLGPAVARNPVVTLAVPAGLDGTTLRAEWEDNRGERGARTLRLDDASPDPAPDLESGPTPGATPGASPTLPASTSPRSSVPLPSSSPTPPTTPSPETLPDREPAR